MKFLKIGTISLAVLLIFGFLLVKPIKVTLSTLLFLPQVFPQIPVKPLGWFTSEPATENIEFFSNSKKVTGIIWRPNDSKTHPVLILAMGVRTAEKDKPVMANFAKALARIGFVVSFVNRQDLQNLKVRIEEKETFISAFEHLSSLPYVDKNKITFVGISVGSSIALKAAQDQQIANKVKALIFFGGYLDAVDYLASLITKTVVWQGKEFSWQPHEHVFNHFKEVVVSLAEKEEQEILSQILLEAKPIDPENFVKISSQGQFTLKLFEVGKRGEFFKIWEQAPERVKLKLEDISPKLGIANVKTKLFILHDRGDRNVPYFESRKLAAALPKNFKRTQLELSLFEHVQPRQGFSWQMLPELLKLYLFIWQIMFFVT